MSLATSNRDGGKTNEAGHLRAIQKVISGEVLNGLAVSQRAAGANMSVDVAIGDAVIPRSDGTYGHPAWNDAVYNISITAADASNPRRDIIVLYIDYGQTPSSAVSNNTNGVVKAVVVNGTAAGSPVDPSAATIQAAIGSGNPYIKLARVRVSAGVTTISNSVIDDLRVMATGLMQDGFSGLSGYTFAYSSASALQVTGADATAVLTPNTKIRIWQAGTLKEFIVTSSSFSTNTTVNLDGRGVYTLANLPIDRVSYSYNEVPGNFSLSTRSDFIKNHIASGCVWSADAPASTRAASMTAGIVYINGKRLVVDAVTARLFTANKDVYIGFIDAGNGKATPVYYDNTTSAASPTLATGGYSMLAAIIQVGATNIAAADRVNNGNFGASYPVVSSVPLTNIDSIGNPIGRRNPVMDTYTRTSLNSSPAPNVEADIAASVIVLNLTEPGNVEIDFGCHMQINSGADRSLYYKMYVDGVSVKQCYGRDNPGASETHFDPMQSYTGWLAAGSHTIKMRAVSSHSGSTAVDSAWLKVRTKADSRA